MLSDRERTLILRLLESRWRDLDDLRFSTPEEEQEDIVGRQLELAEIMEKVKVL